jgi:hypothetical protein
MEAERKRQFLLTALAVVLAVVVYRQWPATTSSPGSASNQRAGGRSTGAATDRPGKEGAAEGTIDVRLESLEAERPKPGPTDRNLFRFREKLPPPPANHGATPPQPVAPLNPEPTGPPQPPPLPPIPLKFIGMFKTAGDRKIAVLSDGSGPPYHGAEGDVVAGRYRILKIGEESIELAYADGRGRQTIRFTGS